jgi:peptide/nickel transport system substrate-binding protein
MHIRKRLTSLAAVGATAALLLTACSGDGGDGDGDTPEGQPGLEGCTDDPNNCNSGERAEGGELTMLISLPFETWNHMRPEGGSVYLIQAMNGVMPDRGRFLPDGSWEWSRALFTEEPQLTSDAPQTMVYQIREEAVWSDGTPITADDFIYDWYHNSGLEEHCVGCNPRATGTLGSVESIVGSDNGKTVTITYQEGINDPEWFANFGPQYPAHVAQAAGFDWQNDPEAMGQSSEYFRDTQPDWSGGAYLIESAVEQERVIYVPNPQYYGQTQPTLERYVAEVIADPASWIPALENRDIDGGFPSTFDVDVYRRLASVPNVYYAAGSAGAVWEHIDMNTENEWLADPVLRNAIFMAIDTADASTRIWGDDIPVNPRTNHIFSEVSEYHQDHITSLGHGSGDAAGALELLTGNGYEFDEAAGLTRDGEQVGPLRFRWTQGNTNRATMGELVQSYLAEIGVEIQLEASEDLGGMLGSQDYDMVIFGWSGSPLFATSPDQFWHSESGSNFGGYSNPQVDTLVKEVQNQADLAVSAELANEAAALVAADAYVLPLWDSPSFDFISDEFVNIRPNHNSSLRMTYNHEAWGLAATAN